MVAATLSKDKKTAADILLNIYVISPLLHRLKKEADGYGRLKDSHRKQ